MRTVDTVIDIQLFKKEFKQESKTEKMNKTFVAILNIVFACLLIIVPMSSIWTMLWADTSAVVISAVGGVLALGTASVAYSHIDPHPI